MYLKTGMRVFFGTLASIYLAVGVGRCAPIMPSVSKDALLGGAEPQIPVIPGTIAEEIPTEFEFKKPLTENSRGVQVDPTDQRTAGSETSPETPYETNTSVPEKVGARSILSSYLKKEFPGAVAGAMLKSSLTLSLTWQEMVMLEETGEVTLTLPENFGQIKKAHVHFVSVNMRRYLLEIASDPVDAIPLNVLRSKKDLTQLTLQVTNASELGSTWDKVSGSLTAIDVYLEIKKAN